MGIVWVDRAGSMADDKQTAVDGPEIQRLFCQGQYAQTGVAGAGCGFCDIFTLAGGAGGIPPLYNGIFTDSEKKCVVLPLKINNMTFSVQVKVMPLKELLDPQGKAVMGGLQNLGIKSVSDVRIGKSISLQIEAATADEAKSIAEEAGRKLLANPVMEYFEIAVN
jgi:phosphoribosylformylglycinamidine synthase